MTDIKYKVNGNWTNAALAIYKVGAIYMSVDSTSPATLFGGTWVALEGRMLIGADSTYSAGTTGGSKTTTLDTNNLPAHAHTVPEHGHGFTQPTVDGGATTTGGGGGHGHNIQTKRSDKRKAGFWTTNAANGSMWNFLAWDAKSEGLAGLEAIAVGNHTHSQSAHTHSVYGGGVWNCGAFNTNNTGSGTAFDTISPYLAVYMWKRTA